MKIDLSNKSFNKNSEPLLKKKSLKISIGNGKVSNKNSKTINLNKTIKVSRNPLDKWDLKQEKIKQKNEKKLEKKSNLAEMSSTRVRSNIITSFLSIFTIISTLLLIFFKTKNEFDIVFIFVVVNFCLLLITFITSFLQYFIFSPKDDLDIIDGYDRNDYDPFRKYVLIKAISSFFGFFISLGFLIVFILYKVDMQTSVLKGFDEIYYIFTSLLLVISFSIFANTILELFW